MTLSLHRFVLAAMLIIAVVWSALAASAAAHPLTPVPSVACAHTAPPRAVPDLEPRDLASRFDQGEYVAWDLDGPPWVSWTDLRVGTHKVQLTVTDCLGRTDTAVVFVEVVDDRDWRVSR